MGVRILRVERRFSSSAERFEVVWVRADEFDMDGIGDLSDANAVVRA